MRNSFFFVVVAAFFMTFISSCGDDDDKIPDNPTTDDVNEWIEKTMRDGYLYYADMPEKSSLDFSADPEAFFEGLLSLQDGKTIDGTHYYFSTLKKSASTKAIDAEDSYGFYYAIYTLSGTADQIAVLVLYVLPGSPAAEAGLVRGDWIMSVDGTSLTLNNHSSLLESGNATSFEIRKYDPVQRKLVADRSVRIDASRAVEDTPFLCDSIYSLSNNKKVGYLFYNHFMTGPDNKDESYNNELKRKFANYVSQGVTDLIVDLRYNGGGRVRSSKLLASLIAPESALGKTFCYMVYNDKKQSDNSTDKFESASDMRGCNLNLSHLYFIVEGSTASSSELVINSLIPYVGRENITLIGEQTYGKLVGSNVYDYSDSYGYILSPISFRLYNANHEADYVDGFAPDINRRELSISDHGFYPLGDRREYLLDIALSVVNGESVESKATPALRNDEESRFKLMGTSFDANRKEAVYLYYKP